MRKAAEMPTGFDGCRAAQVIARYLCRVLLCLRRLWRTNLGYDMGTKCF